MGKEPHASSVFRFLKKKTVKIKTTEIQILFIDEERTKQCNTQKYEAMLCSSVTVTNFKTEIKNSGKTMFTT